MPENLNQQDPLIQFVEKMMERGGMDKLPEKFREEYKLKL